MDALAQYRVSLGEKAVAIDLGILEDEGMLAENPELMARVKLSGALVPIRTRELHAILDYYCDPALGMLTGKTCQPLIGLEMPTNLIARNLEPSPFMYFPTFNHFFQISSSEASSSPQSQGTTSRLCSLPRSRLMK
ncbi:hypothetical protein LARI1_G006973 [Lachnellula arida]|uniref:Uncharacterized protein n=1 Tax=Lachnellula arida TaxID=1316785 RepID=A0A8T9BB78_9HELO|nr:hypothetical protein LARI1_G006973 [Lachnellula arida]